MLSLYIDFKSPGAYLAMAPTLALADRLRLQVSWFPFRTQARDVPKLADRESVGESHRRVRAASRRALDVKYAALQGLELTFPEPLGETDLALGVLGEIAGDPLPFIQAGFAAYWTDHRNLNTPDTIQELLQLSGVDHSGDLSTALATLEMRQSEAEAAGIVDAPAFIIAEQIFVGREHLPWIEELALAGRS